MKKVELIPVNLIDPPVSASRTKPADESLEELAASIRQHGILNPIILNKKGERYYCIAGSRRYLAAMQAKFDLVPAMIVQVSDDEAAIISLHENLFRKNLSAYEEALLLIDLERKYHLTREKIASLVGMSKAWVTQRMDILDWPEVLSSAIMEEKLSFSVARELSKVTDISALLSLMESAIENGVTARVAANWAAEWLGSQVKPTKQEFPADLSNIKSLPGIITCYTCEKGMDPEVDSFRTVILCVDCADALKPREQKPA